MGLLSPGISQEGKGGKVVIDTLKLPPCLLLFLTTIFTGGFSMTDTTNTAKTEPCPTFKRTIDKTTYIVRIHFSQTSKETMADKIKRLLREEVRRM